MGYPESMFITKDSNFLHRIKWNTKFFSDEHHPVSTLMSVDTYPQLPLSIDLITSTTGLRHQSNFHPKALYELFN